MVAPNRVTTPLWLISHIGLSRIFKASFLAAATLLVSSQLALAQFSQQGPKLVGTEVGGPAIAYQGQSVALSSDGSTAIVGGPDDDRFGNGSGGAVWVFTRSNGVWTQQGSKLVANDSVGPAFQGWSVALSADGNTAVVGGDGDNSNIGAAWVYTRSGGVWTQQGSKLVGTGTVGTRALQGQSVALSADGNTAIVGGPFDNYDSNSGGIGAAWVFTNSGGVWTQQGSKLVGSGAVGGAVQGSSVRQIARDRIRGVLGAKWRRRRGRQDHGRLRHDARRHLAGAEHPGPPDGARPEPVGAATGALPLVALADRGCLHPP
jgi:FG-GAP repeat